MARIYQQDSDGLNEIARSPAVRAALKAVAEKAKGIAQGLSAGFTDMDPSDDEDHYIDHFNVEEDTIDWVGEYPGRRAAAYLVNDSDHALAVEWGGVHNDEPHHVLGRTLGMLK